jgi:DNA-binding MarR family transcriptional regulator
MTVTRTDTDTDGAEPATEGKGALAPAEVAADVADTFIRLMRSFNRVKTQMMAEAQYSVEWSASVLISHLAVEGPMRSSALAELVQSDPSTVSRQVASLVKDGFVERRADPVDGRASVLAITERGQHAHLDRCRRRNERYQEMLVGWDQDEVREFTAHLARFADRFDEIRPKWLRDARSAPPSEKQATPSEVQKEEKS